MLFAQPILLLVFAEALLIQVINPLPESVSRVPASTSSKIVAALIPLLALAAGVFIIMGSLKWTRDKHTGRVASATSVLVALVTAGVLAAAPGHDPGPWWIPTVVNSPVNYGFASIWDAPNGRPQGAPAVACAPRGQCLVFGYGVAIYPRQVDSVASSLDDGQWRAHLFGPVELADSDLSEIASVTCPTSARCYLLVPGQAVLYRSDDSGLTWLATFRIQAVGGQFVSRFSCSDSATCYVGIGNSGVVATRDGGRTWRSVLLGPKASILQGVICPTTLDCTLSYSTYDAALLYSTVDGGLIWRRRSVPASSYLVACDGPFRCILSDSEDDESLLTTDAGSRWVRIRRPAAKDTLASAVCPSRLVCFGIEYSANQSPSAPPAVVESNDGGGDWTSVLALPASDRLELGCSSPERCVVVASPPPISAGQVLIYETVDGGRSWTRSPFPALQADQTPPSVELASEFRF